MPAVACPSCQREIPPDDVNVANDVAYCRDCNQAHVLSELAAGDDGDDGEFTSVDQVDLQDPPRGTWYIESGMETIAGASHRSIGAAIGSVAIALFWNGIVSVFVAVGLISTLNLLGVPLPGWLPEFEGEGMGWGMTLFLWVFLTPFILVGLFLMMNIFMCLLGKTEVRISGDEGTVRSGVGFITWRRRFNPHTSQVRLKVKHRRDGDGNAHAHTLIMIVDDGSKIEFGTGLGDRKQAFLVAALRRALRLK